MRVRQIEIPKHISGGIRHRKAGFAKRIRFFSGDVETFEGRPLTIQLADNAKDASIYWVDEETIFPTFLHWIQPRIQRKQVNVCFFHFLAHDLPALLYKYVDKFSENQFSFEAEGVKIDVLAAKIFYAKIIYPDETVLHIIDSFRFYTTSLAKAGKALGCINGKFEKPKGLGKKKFTPLDQNFVDYALQDALLGWEIGKHIIAMHEEFDVPLCISAPQFAARVFTRHFLKEGERIPFPNKHVINASLFSYHGGKNGFYVHPGRYRNVTELDISSAYPNAMRKIPQMIAGKYEYVSEFNPSFVGVYKINGIMKECRYAPFMTHEGKAIHGPCKIVDLWVTSFELQEALRTGEFILETVTGWRWNPDPTYPNNPLAEYAKVFYAKKESCPKGNPEYLTFKLLLNGLYGKFLQNIEVNSEIQAEWIVQEDGTRTRVKRTHKAGGLFNPFIATLITGEVRAYLHRLEHQYEAIHASTDSIKTLHIIEKAALPKGLGGLNIEISGDCILLRNKLYMHYDGPLKECRFADFIKAYAPDRPYHCKPKKYALHGFWGTFDELLAMTERKVTKYQVEHLYKVREALNQGLQPLKTYTQKREVQIEWEAYIDDVGRMEATGEKKENGIQKIPEGIWIRRENQAGYGSEATYGAGGAAGGG